MTNLFRIAKANARRENPEAFASRTQALAVNPAASLAYSGL